MKYIFIILSLFSFPLQIVERTDNSITIETDFNDYILTDTIVKIEDLSTVYNYKRIKKDESVIFVDLKQKTNYYLYQNLEEQNEPKVISTLAKKPKHNCKQIISFKAEPGKIKIITDKVKKSNTLILAKLNEVPANPKNGQDYIPNNGEIEVFNGRLKDRVVTPQLEYGKYYFKVFAYNGNDLSTHYNTEESVNNPRFLYPQLFPPVAISVVGMEENVYRIEWERVDGSLFYELQVSDNKEFKTRLEEYDNADVGNGIIFDIYIEEQYEEMYWRIRAVGEVGRSDFSNILKIQAKK